MKIGLIADTHMPGSMDILWPQASRAFADVEMILHAGDLHTLEIVDHLSEIAPTYVSRGNGDLDIVDDRLKDNWLLSAAGLSIGLIHRFPSPVRKSAEHLEKYVAKHFKDSQPDVLIYGHTHLEDVRSVAGRLYINPGSPTLPRNQSLRLGTIAVLEITGDHVSTQILQLTEDGTIHHNDFEPHKHPRC
jgi:putative phosphoesterase